MKRLITTLFVLSAFITQVFPQYREVKNEAFQRGEFLTYKAYYDAILTGQVVAGTCTFEVTDESKVINGRSTYHIKVIGKTKGAFNLFFKVVDRYETYIDDKAMIPWLFIRRVDEGGYLIKQDLTFNHSKKVAYFKDLQTGRTNTVETPVNIQDLLSAIYYCRTLDFGTLKVNDEMPLKFMLDDTVYSTKIIYLGKETIRTNIGKVRCIKIKPLVLTGTVFKDPYPVLLWVSDDKNKVPVLAESEILVGKVKMEIIGYTGLKNSFSSIVK